MYPLFGPEFFDLLLSLVIAAILGGAIGIERERTKMPAGFRTHVLVTLGAALVMAISKYLYSLDIYQSFDPQRLGAQVISGIGFLGAGTIIRYKASVKGLTTAAGLWASACVGLACGTGFYLGAVVTTVIILVTLIILKKIEKKYSRREMTYVIETDPKDAGKTVPAVIDKCRELDAQICGIDHSDSSIRFKVKLGRGVSMDVLASALSDIGSSLEIKQSH